ncbi:MAG: glycosyltransferase family 10 [Roseburia sp.]|nr:glycosyltransferase family 10 [Roseburia sp.]MCM1201639.1 glycosyltransferase family 10 [Bacteroides fragilis]
MMDIFKEYYHFCETGIPAALQNLPFGRNQRTAVYGMGEHTEHLLSGYRKKIGPIEAELIFIDSRRETLSAQYSGYDIYNVRDIGSLKLDGIVLSSFIYEEEMYRTIRELYGSRFPVYRFYSSEDKKFFLPSGLHWEWEVKKNLPELKINFADMWKSFDRIDNVFTASLKNRYKLILSDAPDLLLFSHFGETHKQYRNCKKVYILTEPYTIRFMNGEEYDYMIGYPYSWERAFFHFNIYAPVNKQLMDRTAFTDPRLAHRKFCNFVYSNETLGEGARLRKEFCMKLQQYKHVDCPGAVLHNMPDAVAGRNHQNWWFDKVRFIGQYKFTIAFENSFLPGYTTEKLFDCFKAGTIPIYWGNPEVARDVNPDAFINGNDFGNDFDAVIQRVKEIDEDDACYMNMLRQAPMKEDYDFDVFSRLEKFFSEMIEREQEK